MTCLEKFMKDHPKYDGRESFIIESYCPNGETAGIRIAEPKFCEGDGSPLCTKCWNRQVPGTEPTTPTIKDSGTRQEFPTGAVRDIQKGKGRCDLLPLDVVSDMYRVDFGTEDPAAIIFDRLHRFTDTGEVAHLFNTLGDFIPVAFGSWSNMLLEVSMHFEEGAEKYGENNWQKGLPVKCYINSAVRHYLKFLREDTDERHDRAFCWNILCAIWTCRHKPELNEYGQKHCPSAAPARPDFDSDSLIGEYEEENE